MEINKKEMLMGDLTAVMDIQLGGRINLRQVMSLEPAYSQFHRIEVLLIPLSLQ